MTVPSVGSPADHPDLAGADPGTAFARLFDTYAPQLRGYLAGRVGSDAAEDLVAETFLTAIRRRVTYDPAAASVRGWLYGIATNLLRNHVRREIRGYRATARARNRLVEQADPADAVAVSRVDAETQMRSLAGALARLRAEDRDVLLLSSWAGLEPGEIAVALDIPASTVRSRLHRVRHKLRALLPTTDEFGDDQNG
ncbi:RNA polymerase sigma factor [Amycolatopsis suaedae]|uniref:RNA polymerase sigma factor n=1 Tax=Amycolatopsis suaedae TaxID=2510978 RepID=A0A4Q7IZL7_9PSEU|nr:RNA polymerase sigma factor [Amycolatopsis suaedae]RZQ59543.1 RNA polymerase sigma factor [Amycolatopsis suaedae]